MKVIKFPINLAFVYILDKFKIEKKYHAVFIKLNYIKY